MDWDDKSDQALVEVLVQKEHALVRARFQNSLNRLENTASLRGLRRDIARVRTELRAREVRQGLPKNSLLALRRQVVVDRSNESATSAGGFLDSLVDTNPG